jgi:hypothetical protein
MQQPQSRSPRAILRYSLSREAHHEGDDGHSQQREPKPLLLEKLSSVTQKDFCNTICQRRILMALAAVR